MDCFWSMGPTSRHGVKCRLSNSRTSRPAWPGGSAPRFRISTDSRSRGCPAADLHTHRLDPANFRRLTRNRSPVLTLRRPGAASLLPLIDGAACGHVDGNGVGEAELELVAVDITGGGSPIGRHHEANPIGAEDTDEVLRLAARPLIVPGKGSGGEACEDESQSQRTHEIPHHMSRAV